MALVVSNRASAFGLQRAAGVGVPTAVHALKPYPDDGRGRGRLRRRPRPRRGRA
ncbi:MAG: hypothetical protein R3F43_12520 [bacterium]